MSKHKIFIGVQRVIIIVLTVVVIEGGLFVLTRLSSEVRTLPEDIGTIAGRIQRSYNAAK